jgi:hypothetical protein
LSVTVTSLCASSVTMLLLNSAKSNQTAIILSVTRHANGQLPYLTINFYLCLCQLVYDICEEVWNKCVRMEDGSSQYLWLWICEHGEWRSISLMWKDLAKGWSSSLTTISDYPMSAFWRVWGCAW